MCLMVRMKSGEVVATQGDLRRYAPVLDDWAFRAMGGLRYHDPADCLCEVNVVVTLNRAGIRVRVPREDDVFDFVEV